MCCVCMERSRNKRGNEWCANHRHVVVCLAAPRDAGYAYALTCMCSTVGPAFLFSFTVSVNVQGITVRSVVAYGCGCYADPAQS